MVGSLVPGFWNVKSSLAARERRNDDVVEVFLTHRQLAR